MDFPFVPRKRRKVDQDHSRYSREKKEFSRNSRDKKEIQNWNSRNSREKKEYIFVIPVIHGKNGKGI